MANPTTSDEPRRLNDPPKTIVEHLDDLRTCLLRSIIAIALGAALAMPFQKFWLRLLVHPVRASVSHLTFLSPAEPFLIQLKLTLAAGFIVVLPYVAYQIWQFVSPALYDHEKNWINRLWGASVGLFIVGLLFAYFVMIPFSLRFFMQFKSDFLVDQITLKNYIGFATFWLIASGIVFQTPLVLIFLMKTGIVPRETLARNRRVMIVIIAIIAAVFSPPDIFTMFLMGVPLYLLFEASLWFAGGIKQQQKEIENESPRQSTAPPAPPGTLASRPLPAAPPDQPPGEGADTALAAAPAAAGSAARPEPEDACASDDENLVSVAVADSEQQAIEWRTYLEAAGIACAIRSFYDRAYDGVYVKKEGFGEILVAEHEANAARSLIDELRNAVQP